ncbi:hypothetical protein FZEAL_3274 [Fusarium zealandicum]|uniref:Zn(2)-C6 fungal-type domain-containing protein n=1 Tax=Fusarium zealandicum TaxID=1053134 RepID=A0A8H4XLZ0_9HYPO|nr:hypothetical protein FZEAL_3274 [Fusarium zealandicum]
MESESPKAEAGPSVRKRVSTACEACRVTKIKCQPSEQPGVCRNVVDGGQQGPPPPAPSKTFTIDFDVPSQPEAEDSFDILRDSHEQLLESIFPSDHESELSAFEESSATGFPTPVSSHTHSIQSLHAKPQFNVDSAASLLASFRGMLLHYPCMALKPEETVSSLAASRPFVLLAILAAASGSRTLQGHSLYDEEFRKVLGLKFVAGGERSLELLQGILIYCAWYPFHLRPKNKQAFQYYRMAGDLIRDLDLDQENPSLASTLPGEMSSLQLDQLRTYLAYYYAASNFMTAWKRTERLIAPWTPWTATCCDALQRCAEADGDIALSYLSRLASLTNTVNESIRDNNVQTEQQVQLLLLGLEAQHRELIQAMLPHIARSAPVNLTDLFFEVFLYGGAVFYLTRGKTRPPGFVPPSSTRLRRCVGNLRSLFDYLLNLGQPIFMSFTSVDWTKFVMAVIVAVRLSFPIPEIPDWDDAWARAQLGFEAFLETMCEGAELTPASIGVDALSASRVVLRIVRAKYDRRLAMFRASATAAANVNGSNVRGCPMFDRSMEQYITAWDTGYDVSSAMPSQSQEGQQPVFHDLWATMTMGWANDGQMDW